LYIGLINSGVAVFDGQRVHMFDRDLAVAVAFVPPELGRGWIGE